MNNYIATFESKNEFDYAHSIDDTPEASHFKLHNHNDTYEILLFIRGNCEFHVEGTVYYLKPYDIVTARKDEMHIMCHNEPQTPYERIRINIKDDFFVKNDCEEFKGIFTNRSLGENNLISSDLVNQHSLLQIIMDMEKYIKKDKASAKIVLRSKMIELLYNMNYLRGKSDKERFYDERIKNILLYINENLTSDLSLDKIAGHFFQSKYHICHVFKEQTGMTINQYIIYKRLLLVRELYFQGRSLTDASMEAGFGSYSTFYKLYTREMGKSPREDLSTKRETALKH